MAAIIEVPNHYTPGRGTVPTPHVRTAPVGVPGPRSRVVRNRLLSLALVALVLLVAFVALRPAQYAPSSGVAGSGAAEGHLVVGPGDTLYSIAGELDPTGPRHEMVARLVELNGGELAVELGDVVVVPDSLR
jgi:hypothetical protein